MFLVYQIQIHFLAITVARPEAEIHISYDEPMSDRMYYSTTFIILYRT